MNQKDRDRLAEMLEAVQSIPEIRLPARGVIAAAYVAQAREIHAQLGQAIMAVARPDVEEPEEELELLRWMIQKMTARIDAL